jgi:hypothetical protein
MSAPFNPSPNPYQEDIEQMKKCIDYLNKSSYDINVNMKRLIPYIPMLSTQEKRNALKVDIERMDQTATRLLSDISTLTSEYRKILAEKQMNPTLEEKMIELNNRLMDVDRRKRDLFDNILKTLAKYHIQHTYEASAKEEIEDDNNAETSGGRRYRSHRKQRTLRKKRTHRKRAHRKRTKRNRA